MARRIAPSKPPRGWREDGRSVPQARDQREASFDNWKAKYGALEVSEAQRLKGLESENARPSVPPDFVKHEGHASTDPGGRQLEPQS